MKTLRILAAGYTIVSLAALAWILLLAAADAIANRTGHRR